MFRPNVSMQSEGYMAQQPSHAPDCTGVRTSNMIQQFIQDDCPCVTNEEIKHACYILWEKATYSAKVVCTYMYAVRGEMNRLKIGLTAELIWRRE